MIRDSSATILSSINDDILKHKISHQNGIIFITLRLNFAKFLNFARGVACLSTGAGG